MNYKKLIELIEKYINRDMDMADASDFCDTYMEEFIDIQDELEEEVDTSIYELFDDLNLVCDSYEPNIEIRSSDNYCIDEKKLKEKLNGIYNQIISLSSTKK